MILRAVRLERAPAVLFAAAFGFVTITFQFPTMAVCDLDDYFFAADIDEKSTQFYDPPLLCGGFLPFSPIFFSWLGHVVPLLQILQPGPSASEIPCRSPPPATR